MTRPVASVRRVGMAPNVPRAERSRQLAREFRAHVAEARALVADLLPDKPRNGRRKYEDIDALGEIIRQSGRKPAQAAWHRAMEARNALVMLNRKLAYAEARAYRQGPYAEEMQQEALLGLIDAANRYNPDEKANFGSFAGWWSRTRMVRAMYTLREVRVPANAAYDAGLATELQKQGLSERQIAEEMHTTVERVRELWGVNPEVQSLDERLPEGQMFHALIQDQDALDEEALTEALHERARAQQLRDALDSLDERQRTILVGRHGLDGNDPATLEEIGQALGISRERVRQLSGRAMASLRAALTGSPHRKDGSPVHVRVASLLTETPWLTVGEMSDALGADLSGLQRQVRLMHRAGDLIRIRHMAGYRYAHAGTPLPSEQREVA